MRKPWLVGGVITLGLSLVLAGIVRNLWALVACWCLAQIAMNAVQSALQAAVADSIPESRLGKVSGAGAAAVPLAILASVLALRFFETNEERFAIPALLGVGMCLVPSLLFRDPTSFARRSKIDGNRASRGAATARWVYRRFWIVCASRVLIMCGYASITTYLMLFFAAAFAMSPAEQLSFNVWATGVSVVTMVVSAIICGTLSDRYGKRHLFVMISGLMIAIGVACVALSPALTLAAARAAVIVGEAFVGCGFGAFVSVGTALGIDLLPDPQSKARDIGFLNLSNSIPGVLAPIIAGAFVIPFGESIHAGWGFSGWFLIAGALTAIGGFLNLAVAPPAPH